MRSSPIRVTVLVCVGLIPFLCALHEAVASPEIRWNPVTASGNVICTPGNDCCSETEITLSEGGVTVTLFLEVSGWDPDQDGDPSLGAVQGTLDFGTLYGGLPPGEGTLPGVDLVPVGYPDRPYDGAFMTPMVCGDIFDPDDFDPLGGALPGGGCETYTDCPESHHFCIERPDFIFYHLYPYYFPCSVRASMDGYSWSCATTYCRMDPDGGETKAYGGTLLLEVPVGATGTYNVNFVHDPDFTLMNSCPGPLIPDLVLTPGKITIRGDRCCYGIGTPEAGCLDGTTWQVCDVMPGPRTFDRGKRCAEGCGACGIVGSKPHRQGSLWRSKNNVVRLTTGCNLRETPAGGEVEIVELLDNGTYGPDLSAFFAFEIEDDDQGDPRVLRIQDTGATLEHRRWYAIRNVGDWPGMPPFEIHYLVQVGDVNGDMFVTSLDVGAINAGIPCFANCGNDNRLDVDGDGRVISLDVGVVNRHIGSFSVPKPSGH